MGSVAIAIASDANAIFRARIAFASGAIAIGSVGIAIASGVDAIFRALVAIASGADAMGGLQVAIAWDERARGRSESTELATLGVRRRARAGAVRWHLRPSDGTTVDTASAPRARGDARDSSGAFALVMVTRA